MKKSIHKLECKCFRCTHIPWNKGLAGKGICKPNSGSFKKGQESWLKGAHIKTNTGKTNFKIGHMAWHTGKKGLMLNSGRTHFKKGMKPWSKGKHVFQTRGEKNGNWKGGVTSIYSKIRQSLEYEEWRKAVFERDLYTCQHCNKIGDRLEADHIKPFSLFPELRLDITNGRTLCKECHKKTESYLNSHMKREDFVND